jgi:hypothetical protein
MMRALKYTSVWLLSLLIAIAISFLLQRKLGLLDPSYKLESLAIRVAAWPLLIWVAAATLALTVQSVRAEVRNQKLAAERQQAQQLAEQEQQKLADAKAHQEFAIVLTGAQLTTALFDRTKPLAHYMNPMLEQLKPYRKKPKGVYAPAIAYEDDKEEPTMERRLVLYLTQLADKLIWPFRFPAQSGEFVYKDIGKLPINQFLTLPKEFEAREPERLAAIERGEWDPAIPAEFSRTDTRPLDVLPPMWRWHWRYIGVLKMYLLYKPQKPFTEFNYHFAQAGGYDAIKNAFDFIEAHPLGKNLHPLAWTLAVDAPQFVKAETDRNANDSGTLLMWSHPQADTGRRPLVLLHRPVTLIQPDDKPLSSRQVQATIADALENADVRIDDIGYLVTDFGLGKPGDDYLGQAGNALAQLADDSEHATQLLMNRTDLIASLDDIGANTAGFSSLIAAWAAFSQNRPSLLVSRSAPDRIDVLVFKPRDNHVPPAHDKPYYGAVAEPEFSRPWWGERLDGKPDFGDEPNKQRADGNGLVKPAKPFEFTWQE